MRCKLTKACSPGCSACGAEDGKKVEIDCSESSSFVSTSVSWPPVYMGLYCNRLIKCVLRYSLGSSRELSCGLPIVTTWVENTSVFQAPIRGHHGIQSMLENGGQVLLYHVI